MTAETAASIRGWVGAAVLLSCAAAATWLPRTETDTAGPTSHAEPLKAGARWGADYFPNPELITHRGEKLRFFDDLIEGKVVMINFIYTSCPDSCPLETARLAEVARILGDRVGDDVFIYSISIDPETDTPEVLAQYARRYRAMPGWLFLTGQEDEIVDLRKKLGLYIPEIQSDDSNNHNLSLIIGNQSTGRWMKRSPFENPHVLATQVGSWLHDWRAPTEGNREFAQAPQLRSLSDGERLFRTRCAACHTIGERVIGNAVPTDANRMGPDLLGVTERRDPAWLSRWLREPDVMLKEKDPLAMQLFAAYGELAMPNMRLGQEDVHDLLEFVAHETKRARKHAAPNRHSQGSLTVENAWIREGHASQRVHAGYFTLRNQGERERTLVGVHSDAHEKAELHEMRGAGDDMRMRAMRRLRVPARGSVEFAPLGSHLMLIGATGPLERGKEVSIRLSFADGEQESMVVPFGVWPEGPESKSVAMRDSKTPDSRH